jgi:signal transduction histidine kinase
LSSNLVVSLGLGALGLFTYASVRSALIREFDHDLLSRANSLAALTELSEDGYEVDITAATAQVLPGRDAELLWAGEVFRITMAASRELLGQSADLDKNISLSPRVVGSNELTKEVRSPRFDWCRLPNGDAGRVVALDFVPRVDDEVSETPELAKLVKSASDPVAIVEVARPTVRMNRLLYSLAGILSVGGGVILATSSGLIYWTVFTGIRPLAETATLIDGVDVDSAASRMLPDPAVRELAPIVSTLNRLLARVRDSIERERAFSSDVAHELRTPLAGLKSTMEVCLSQGRSEREYREELEYCLSICNQSSTMIETLLEMARLESGQVTVNRVSIHFNQLVEECWLELKDRVSAQDSQVDWNLSADPDVVHTDSDKLRIVVRNLLENAVCHGDPGKMIRISTRNEPGSILLHLENSATNLKSQDTQKVFERFWRGEQSRQQTGQHFGLGMSLVQRLTRILNLQLSVQIQNQVFHVKLFVNAKSA